MKAFIIAALTADGFIAENSSHAATWTSKADKEFFRKRTKEAGVMVMGSKTFETIGKALPGRKTVVYTSSKSYEGVETTKESPAELLARLEKEGFSEAAICGGSSIYTLFMKSGLVSKLYVTVEPVTFGTGMGLFNEKMNTTLSLVSSTPLEGGAVLLEYDVIKS